MLGSLFINGVYFIGVVGIRMGAWLCGMVTTDIREYGSPTTAVNTTTTTTTTAIISPTTPRTRSLHHVTYTRDENKDAKHTNLLKGEQKFLRDHSQHFTRISSAYSVAENLHSPIHISAETQHSCEPQASFPNNIALPMIAWCQQTSLVESFPRAQTPSLLVSHRHPRIDEIIKSAEREKTFVLKHNKQDAGQSAYVIDLPLPLPVYFSTSTTTPSITFQDGQTFYRYTGAPSISLSLSLPQPSSLLSSISSSFVPQSLCVHHPYIVN